MPSHGNKKTLLEFATLLCLLQTVTYIHNAGAHYIFKVEIRSYSNPDNKKSDGDCCDLFCGDCDPFYDIFCLRNRGHTHQDRSTCSLGSYTTPIRSIPATATITSNNPWPVDFQLYIQVQEEDSISSNDLLDRLFIDHAQNTSSQFSDVQSFQGDFRVVTLGLRFEVTCMTDYYGLDCSTFCRARSDSSGRYTCNPSTGAIVCELGYQDPSSNCNEPICMEGCHPVGGYCDSPGECLCQENWNGTLCDDLDTCLSSPCANGSTCLNLVGNDSYACMCALGFEGLDCEINSNECASRPCKNGGTCMDLTADYSCSCLPGFTDENCTANIDECEGASCPGNSRCVDRVDSHECVCDPGFAGPNCDPDDSGNTDSQGSELSSSVIAGAAVGGIAALAFILLLILVMLLCLKRRHAYQKENFTAIASLKNHSSSGHHSYQIYTPSDGIEMPEQPNVKFSAPSGHGLLTDNPLYGEHQPESTGDFRPPDSMTSTLHEVDNPLYGSGANSDQIYSEPNPAYIQSPQKTIKNNGLEPHGNKVDCSPHYDYASTSGPWPQDTGGPTTNLTMAPTKRPNSQD